MYVTQFDILLSLVRYVLFFFSLFFNMNLSNHSFVTLYKIQGSRLSQEKEMQKIKMALRGGLKNSCKKKRRKKQRRKKKDIPI